MESPCQEGITQLRVNNVFYVSIGCISIESDCTNLITVGGLNTEHWNTKHLEVEAC